MGVVISMFLRAIVASLLGLGSIGHYFWNYGNPATKWEGNTELYGGISLVCVGLFSAIMNFQRLRKGPPTRDQ
jgi:hypothetical protein